MSKEIEQRRQRFMKVFADLPLGLRGEIIAVIDDGPMTWRVCWLEVEQKTAKGNEILTYLDEMQFI